MGRARIGSWSGPKGWLSGPGESSKLGPKEPSGAGFWGRKAAAEGCSGSLFVDPGKGLQGARRALLLGAEQSLGGGSNSGLLRSAVADRS